MEGELPQVPLQLLVKLLEVPGESENPSFLAPTPQGKSSVGVAVEVTQSIVRVRKVEDFVDDRV